MFFFTTSCRNSLPSSSVDDSVKPEDDELLLFSSASILVCIASSAFVFPSIFASTLANRALFSCHIVDKVAPSVAVILSLFCFYQSHDRFVILLASLSVSFLELLDSGVHGC